MDSAIFSSRYFGHCLSCGFCADACCEYGVDVSVMERDRILAHAPALAMHVPADPSTWFVGPTEPDQDFPGGASTRTGVSEGRCVFLRRAGRGCLLHAVSLELAIDYHVLKPMVSALFPLTFHSGVLLCSDEVEEGTLVCAGDGPTVFAMARPELAYYFGEELVQELDRLAAM